MANAYLNYAKSTRLPVIIRKAGSAARLGTNAIFYTFLGSTTNNSDQQAEIVDIANEKVRNLLDEFPLLNVESTALETVAAQRHVLLPTTLRQVDVVDIVWADGSEYDGKPVSIISREEALLLGPRILSEAVTVDHPAFAVIAWEQESGQGKIEFYPTPSTAIDFTLVYRQKETPFTTRDLALITPTVVGGIITAATATYAGGGFTAVPTLTVVNGGAGSGATMTTTIVNGGIGVITVGGAGGTGYTTMPTVQITGADTICAIPDDMITLLAQDIAIELQDRGLMQGAETTNKLELKRAELAGKWVSKFCRGAFGAYARAEFGRGGYPRTHSDKRMWDFEGQQGII